MQNNKPGTRLELIIPDWNVPKHVQAVSTTRKEGVSRQGFASLNLACHVNDNPVHVEHNRHLLKQRLELPVEPEWLRQTHSTTVIDLDHDESRDGDAAITTTLGKIAVVLTADCMPVLFCNSQGSEVAAAHAGWRGLLKGVLEQTVLQMNSTPEEILAWMGPAIGPQHFEVGEEVRELFIQHTPDNAHFFSLSRPGHYLADLYSIARLRLNKLGIKQVSGGGRCTYSESSTFFSYRREKVTGRQASLIYINKNQPEKY